MVIGSPGLVNYWAAEYRSSYGNVSGPGYYMLCAYMLCATNNGTAKTTASIQLRTDYEF